MSKLKAVRSFICFIKHFPSPAFHFVTHKPSSSVVAAKRFFVCLPLFQPQLTTWSLRKILFSRFFPFWKSEPACAPRFCCSSCASSVYYSQEAHSIACYCSCRYFQCCATFLVFNSLFQCLQAELFCIVYVLWSIHPFPLYCLLLFLSMWTEMYGNVSRLLTVILLFNPNPHSSYWELFLLLPCDLRSVANAAQAIPSSLSVCLTKLQGFQLFFLACFSFTLNPTLKSPPLAAASD